MSEAMCACASCRMAEPHEEPTVPADNGAAKVSRRIAELEQSISHLSQDPGYRDFRAALLNEVHGLRFALEALTGVP